MAYTKNSWEPGDVITAAKLNHMEDGIAASDLSESVKTALLQIAAKVAYIDDQGQEYYDALEEALYPDKTLTGIGAVYDQSGTVYPSTSLDSLKSDLTVTAYYDDGSTAAVTTYTLSGTLTVGTSTITATYSGFTDTFEVTVSAAPTVSSIAAVYTQSGTVYDTDSLDSLKADLVVTATYSDSSTATVPSADYTLSGTLAAGTSTITVSYEGKTTTFNVTVTHKVEALYPLTDGVYQISETRLLEISNGNHIKLSVTSDFSVSGGHFLNLNSHVWSSSASAVNNQPTWFTIPAATEAVFSLSNVVNSGSYPFTMNFRKASANTSGSFGTGKGDHTSGVTVTQTLASAENEGCLFIYFDTTPIPSGTVLEFDVSLLVGDDKYI